jgi:EpsI family protein
MSAFARRYVIAIVLLSATAFITFGAYSTRSNSDVLYTGNIPIIVGDWYGKDIPMDDNTYDILETRDAFMRQYVNSSNERVMFTIVFARDNRKVAHPPEVCFSGGGWERANRDIQTMSAGNLAVKANRLILQKGTEKQVVFYLYKAGEKFTPNYYAQQLNIILNGMLRKDTSSALIRVSSMDNGDVAEATDRVRRFAEEMIPIVEEYLP